MPVAICKDEKCGKTQRWRNQRGRKIADLQCECGCGMRSAKWVNGGYIAAIREGHKGKRVVCGVCGKHFVDKGHTLTTLYLELDGRCTDNDHEGRTWYRHNVRVSLSPDDRICWRHYWGRLRPYDLDIDTRNWWIYSQPF